MNNLAERLMEITITDVVNGLATTISMCRVKTEEKTYYSVSVGYMDKFNNFTQIAQRMFDCIHVARNYCSMYSKVIENIVENTFSIRTEE